MLFAEMSSNEWIALSSIVAAVAVPSTVGWVAVFIQLVLMRNEVKVLNKALLRLEQDAVRNWEHVTKHEGRIDQLDRLGNRLLRNLTNAQRSARRSSSRRPDDDLPNS